MGNKFEPDWASPPGDTIKDMLEEKHMSAKDLADAMGIGMKRMDGLLEGSEIITGTIAEKLYQVLGVSARFWVSREEHYRKALHRLHVTKVPSKEMIAFIDDVGRLYVNFRYSNNDLCDMVNELGELLDKHGLRCNVCKDPIMKHSWDCKVRDHDIEN